jgi:hypothetical protein
MLNLASPENQMSFTCHQAFNMKGRIGTSISSGQGGFATEFFFFATASFTTEQIQFKRLLCRSETQPLTIHQTDKSGDTSSLLWLIAACSDRETMRSNSSPTAASARPTRTGGTETDS